MQQANSDIYRRGWMQKICGITIRIVMAVWMIMGGAVSLSVMAQDVPVVTMKTTATSAIKLTIKGEAGHTVSIDNGSGTLTPHTFPSTGNLEDISVTPAGTKEIKIYALQETITMLTLLGDCKLTMLNVSRCAALTKLYCLDNTNLTSLTLPTEKGKLESLKCGNSKLSVLDVSEYRALTHLDCSNCKNLISLTLPAEKTKLNEIYCSDCSLTSLDLSEYVDMQRVACFNNPALTSLILPTAKNKLRYLYCYGCSLTELDVSEYPDFVYLKCQRNRIQINRLLLRDRAYLERYYAPQAADLIPGSIAVGETLDLSRLAGLRGVTSSIQPTTFTWKTKMDNASFTGYTTVPESGKFIFTTAPSDSIYCEVATAAFPDFTGANTYRTTYIKVTEVVPVITMTSTATEIIRVRVKGTEGQTISIDNGSGTQTAYTFTVTNTFQSIPVTPTATKVIKIYDSQGTITSLECKDGSLTSLDVSNCAALTELNCSNNPALTSTNLKLPTEKERLKLLNSANCNLSTLDVSGYTTLTSLNCSGNPDLTSLKCSSCSLVSLNVSSCAALTELNCSGNTTLTSLTLPTEKTKLLTLDCSNCLLSLLDVSAYTALNNLKCYDNRIPLNELKISATPPATFQYDLQAADPIQSTLSVGETLDLSRLEGLTGIKSMAQTTRFGWKTKTGTTLSTSYYTTTPGTGKFVFTAIPPDSIYCVLTTPAFPLYTTAKPYRTTCVKVIAAVPVITMTSTATTPINLRFTGIAGATISIDDGSGTLTSLTLGASAEDIRVTPTGSKVIKVYDPRATINYLGCWNCSLTTLDVSGCTVLSGLECHDNNSLTDLTLPTVKGTLEKLNCNKCQLTVLNVAAYSALTDLDCSENSSLTTAGLTLPTTKNKLNILRCKNCSLTSLNVAEYTQLSELHCSDNSSLTSLTLPVAKDKLLRLYCNNCMLPTLNVADYTELRALYCSLNSTLTSLTLPTVTDKLKILYCFSCRLTKLDVSGYTALTELICKDNRIPLNELKLPATLPTTLTYVPQAADPIPGAISVGEILDLSRLTGLTGVTSSLQPTTFTWKTKTDGATFTDYTTVPESGKFIFTTAPSDSIYCEVATAAFPDFTSQNGYRTANIRVEVLTVLSINPTPQTFVYNAAVHSFSVTSSVVALPGFTVTYSLGGTPVSTPTDAGSYDVTVIRSGDAVYAAFTQTIASGLVIRPSDLTLTAPTASSVIVGTQLSNSVLSGGSAIRAGSSVVVPGTFAWADATELVPATAMFTIIFTPTDTRNHNSGTCTAEVTVTTAPIDPVDPIVITIDPTPQTFVYNAAAHSFSVTSSVSSLSDFTVTYNLGGTPVSTPTDAGSYDVTVIRSGDAVYAAFTQTIASGLVIRPSDLTLTAPTASSVIVGTQLSNSVLSGGSAMRAGSSVVVPGTFAWADATELVPATAVFTIIFTPTDTRNHNSGTCTAEVTATAAPIEPVEPIVIIINPTPQTFVYNAAAHSFSVTSSVSSLSDFTVTYNLGGTPVSTPTDAGSYDVTVTRSGDAVYAAFTQTIASGLVIHPSDLTLTAPTASSVIVGTQLSGSILSGGSAIRAGSSVVVPGTFAWADATELVPATAVFTIIFTPTDTRNYNSGTCTAEVTVITAPIDPVTYTVTYTSPQNGLLTVTADGLPVPSGTRLQDETELLITAEPAAFCEMESLTANGTPIVSGDLYLLRADLLIAATFRRNDLPVAKTINIIEPHDNNNTRFLIFGRERFTSVSLKMYNVQGKLIYTNRNYAEDEYDMRDLPRGAYYYIIDAINIAGQRETLRGGVEVVK